MTLHHEGTEPSEQPPTDWTALLRNIFSDRRFRRSKTSRRRWLAEIDGNRIGVVVAWCPADYENFALNKADFDRLLDLKSDGSFAAAFIVLATVSGYVGHRDAVQFCETLKSVPFRKGPHGEYWLLTASAGRTDNRPAHSHIKITRITERVVRSSPTLIGCI